MEDNQIRLAMRVLERALREDKELYRAWKSNIAMSFHDEYYERGKQCLDGDELHQYFNDGADRFLQMLIYTPDKTN